MIALAKVQSVQVQIELLQVLYLCKFHVSKRHNIKYILCMKIDLLIYLHHIKLENSRSYICEYRLIMIC